MCGFLLGHRDTKVTKVTPHEQPAMVFTTVLIFPLPMNGNDYM
jgi:hypothetical protein